jgi:quercetin dioxygenase-like cupin family protein
MRIRIERKELTLEEGDEVIVLPGTVHEVLNSGREFLVRVHAINCYGEMDKYIERPGAWCQVKTLKEQERAAR